MKTNPVLECIATRRSVRNFTDKKVSLEDIELILRAAMAAPSAKNHQPWEFVVVRERAVLDELASKLTYAKMLFTAPLAIIVCGDTLIHNEDGSTQPNLRSVQDCSAATENILLAAHALGLGAVWTAADDELRAGVVIDTIGLPSTIKPLCVIPIGYPADERHPKDKWHTEKIHFEKW